VKLLAGSIIGYLKRDGSTLSLEEKRISISRKVILLAFIVSLSVMLAIIPHLPSVNKDAQPVGVDTPYYVTWVTALEDSQDAIDFFNQAFVIQNQGQRPLSLLFIYALDEIPGTDLFFVIEYLPLILGPALALTFYFLTRELTSNDLAAVLAAFITVVSFHTLIGIYAGFYANWIALIVGNLSFVFLFRFLKKGGTFNILLFGLLTLTTLLSHVYTWSILTIAAGVFLAVEMARSRKVHIIQRNAALLLGVLVFSVAVDVGRAYVAGTSGGIESDLNLAQNFVSPDQFVLRWNNLSYTTTTFVGGLFANFIILGLGLYWLARTEVADRTSIFLMVFLSVGILPFLFGEWVIQTRVFYDLPFQIPAAIALTHIVGIGKSFRPIPILIWFVVMAIMAVSNFYLVVPELPTASSPS
jgi:hypothetical protein